MSNNNLKMLFLALLFVLIFLVFTGTLIYFSHYYDFDLYSFYSSKMQVPLFTAFLTLGSFLLTLKTFILIKLKEGVYDQPYYRDTIKKQRAVTPDISFYGPLTRLGTFLMFSVLGALLTSFFQFSFGFIRCNYIAAIGISLAFTTIITVIIAWWQIRINLLYWFKAIEDEQTKKEKDQEKEEEKLA